MVSGSLMVIEADELHPILSVMFTVYVPAQRLVAVGVV